MNKMTQKMTALLARLPQNFQLEEYAETARSYSETHVVNSDTNQQVFRLGAAHRTLAALQRAGAVRWLRGEQTAARVTRYFEKTTEVR